ncbi:MAG: C97 family peptidase [Lachnospiraceae bacterium]|nr:C97 family peptidase [Lachnospiraceae bacterium]
MANDWMTEMSEDENGLIDEALAAKFADSNPLTTQEDGAGTTTDTEAEGPGSIMSGMNSQGKYNALLSLLLGTANVNEEDAQNPAFDMRAMGSNSSMEFTKLVNSLVDLTRYMDNNAIVDEAAFENDISFRSLVTEVRLFAVAYMDKNSGRRIRSNGKLRKAVAHQIVKLTENSLSKLAKSNDNDNIIEKARERQSILASDSKLKGLVKDSSLDDKVSDQPVIQTFVKYPGSITQQHSFIGLRYTEISTDQRRPYKRKEIRVGFGSGWKFPVGPVRIMNDFHTRIDASTSTKVTNEKINQTLRVIQSKENDVYRLFTHNCNHFVKEITDEIGLQALREIHTAVFPGGALAKIQKIGKDAEQHGGVESVMDASGHVIDIKPTGEEVAPDADWRRKVSGMEREQRISAGSDTKELPLVVRAKVEKGLGNDEQELLRKAGIADGTREASKNVNSYIGSAGWATTDTYRQLLMKLVGFDFMQRSPNLTFIDVLNQLVTGVRTAVGASNMTADDPFFIFMKNFKIGRITLSNFDLARLLTGMLMDSGEVGDIFRRNRNGGREQQGGLGNFEIYAKSMLLNSKSIINDNQNSGKKRFGAEATDDSITSTRDMLDRHRRVNAEMYGDSAAIQGIMDTVANYRISMVSMFEGYLDAMPEFA